MAHDPILAITFRYTEPDIVSAHRLRFRTSTRLRMLGAFGAAAFAVTAAPRLVPGLFGRQAGLDWFIPLAILAVFILAPLLMYVLMPRVDYGRNPIWRSEYTLTVNDEGLRLSRPGATRDLEAPWAYVSRVLENEQVFVLYFGGSQDFLVIPRRAFAGPEQETLFRAAAKAH